MKITTAIVAALCLVVATSHADARSYKKHHRHHAAKTSQFTQIYGRPGGHRQGYAEEPFLYRNGGYGNTPYFDGRNFWERVQSGQFDEMTSPSAF